MLQSVHAKRTELYTSLLAAVVGALLSLAGVYWQSAQSDQQVRREAVEKYLDAYGHAFVEIEYFGNKRVPARALSTSEKEDLRKEVRGVYAACTQLVLITPELGATATKARDALGNWEKAIIGPVPYGRAQQAAHIGAFDAAMAEFLSQAKRSLGLP